MCSVCSAYPRCQVTGTCTYLPIPSIVFSDYKYKNIPSSDWSVVYLFPSVCFTREQFRFTHLLFSGCILEGRSTTGSVRGLSGWWLRNLSRSTSAPARTSPRCLWVCSSAASAILHFVHVSTSLAERELSLLWSTSTFSFEKSCVLSDSRAPAGPQEALSHGPRLRGGGKSPLYCVD